MNPSIANQRKETLRGRGTAHNPSNRFEKIEWEKDPEWDDSESPSPKTEFYVDASRSIIAYNDSPDVGFSAGINPYRGCEHGCIYCYARPNHEYLGFSAGLDFETKIFVKREAPELLRKELSAGRWKPQTVGFSGITDCYQPAERRFQLTRQCLEVLAEFRNPAVVITKNRLVTRDIDVFKKMADHQAIKIFVSVTTLDADLARMMEPRTSCPADRLRAIRELSTAGIPVGVLTAPVVPALTDHEIPLILKEAAAAGARWAGHVILRLPYGVKDLFEQWLIERFPDRKDKILNRIRAIRGGNLNDPRFEHRMSGQGIFAEQIHNLFEVACRRNGLNKKRMTLSTAAFRKPPGAQMELFES